MINLIRTGLPQKTQVANLHIRKLMSHDLWKSDITTESIDIKGQQGTIGNSIMLVNLMAKTQDPSKVRLSNFIQEIIWTTLYL